MISILRGVWNNNLDLAYGIKDVIFPPCSCEGLYPSSLWKLIMRTLSVTMERRENEGPAERRWHKKL